MEEKIKDVGYSIKDLKNMVCEFTAKKMARQARSRRI